MNVILKRWLTMLARILSYEAAFAGFLLFVVFISYGLFLPRMGFYWDDWETIYLARNNTFSVYWHYFIFDRPQAVWTQMLLVPLLGMNPLKWQVFGLLMRWLNAYVMVRALGSIWPGQKFLLRSAGVLVAVYPGFQQQALSAIYSRYLMLATLFFLSLWLMVLAYRSPTRRVWLSGLSILLGLLQALTLEYFASLELLRPLLLYFLVRQDAPEKPQAVRRTLRFWLPYVLVPAAFLVYRYMFLPAMLPEEPHPLIWVERFAQAPVKALFDFAQVIAGNFIYVAFSAWTRQVESMSLLARENSDNLARLIGVVLGILVALFLGFTNGRSVAHATHTRYRELVLVGAIGILAGLLPVLVLGREPLVGKWSDRLALPAMYGSVLLLVGLLGYALVNHWVKTISIGILVALAVTGHVQTTRTFRYDWKDLTEFFWQVVWRAPSVERSTVFVSPELPFFSQAGYSLGLATDLIYGSGMDPANPEYWWQEAESFDLASANPGYNFRLRNIGFDASFDKAIFLDIGKRGSCVHVLDEAYRGSALMAEDTQVALVMQSFANTHRILSASPGITLPAEIFGPEPPHTWCYYFQKADLARQQEDWQGVIALYEAARQQGFQADNGAEYLPLILAYLHTGQWSTAVDETVVASRFTSYNNIPGLCLAWQNYADSATSLSSTGLAGFTEHKQRVDSQLACDKD